MGILVPAPPTYPPAAATVVAAAERALGFSLPDFLRELYLNVANGGFGPGYGIMGITDGFPDDQGKRVVDLYQLFTGPDHSDPAWRWPSRLVPFCHFGCAIYTCVDCNNPRGAIAVWDPNIHAAGADPREAMREVCDDIESWFSMWAAGESLWDKMFSKVESSPGSDALTAPQSRPNRS